MTNESLRLGNLSLTSRKLRTIILSTFLLFSIGQIWGAANSTTISGSSITGFGSGSNYTSGSYDAGDIGIASNGGFSTTQFRVGKSKTMTISTEYGKITKIEITCSSSSYLFNDATNLSYSGSVGTYTNAAGVTSVTFTNSNANIARITQIKVTYGYLVTYNKNDAGASGTMTDANSPYAKNATVTVKSNSFTAPSNKTFSSWNIAAGGGSTSYAPSATFKITAHTTLYAQWVSSCANTVTIDKGASTNCSFSLDISGAQASCDGVVTTISITPNTGYGTPVVSESGASSTPTKEGSGNSQTLTYAANTTGTSTIAVSCSANTYTINLDKDLTPTSAGTPSITATYNSNSNLTSAITPPTKTGWTFAGYFTAKNGGGTQIIDASGNVIASAGGGSTYTDASKNWKYAGDITLYAKWTCTVTWSVNNLTNVYSAQTLTYNGSSTKVASIPGPPSPASYCGDKFVGWTTEANVSQDDDDGLGLFTTVAGSPELKTVGNTTFYAVFADYDE